MPRQQLPWSPDSVSEARRTMAMYLRGNGVAPTVVDDSILVLSEMLSNALRHAHPLGEGLEVSWEVQGDDVRISVTDGGGAAPPAMGAPTHASQSGRGLRIIGELSCDWGVVSGVGMQTVWAIVPAPEGGAWIDNGHPAR